MKTRLLFYMLSLFTLGIFGQAEPYEAKFPATPTVASLAKYADIPVGYYSGTANVGIPLYNIQVGDFTLPINLSYNTSGIKVAQEASNVGLGWSLFAGGVITREIRGLDDFAQNNKIGYFFNYDNYHYPDTEILVPDPQGSVGSQTHHNLAYHYGYRHYRDGEPDLFMFNFAGYSGKFILQGEKIGAKFYGNGILLDQEKNLKIKFEINGHDYIFTLTDERGIQYTFSLIEESEVVTFSGENFGSINSLAGGSLFPPKTKNSWHLTKIVLTNGEEINFNYKADGHGDYGIIKSIPTTSQTKYILSTQTGSGGTTTNPRPATNSYYRSLNTSEVYILDNIQWSSGKIEFTTTGRDDTNSDIAGIKNQKISRIKVYSTPSNTLIKDYELKYNYFTNNSNRAEGQHYSKRLKLESLLEHPTDDTENLTPKKHVFQYNETDNLPDKDSNDYDHWGYFNNANNAEGDLLAAEEDENMQDKLWERFNLYGVQTGAIFTDGANRVPYFDGADRESNANAAQVGILTQIQYPTGGTENLEYELNTYVKKEEDDLNPYELVNKSNPVAFAYSPDIGGNFYESEREFTITEETTHPRFWFQYTAETLEAYAANAYDGFFGIELWKGNSKIKTFACPDTLLDRDLGDIVPVQCENIFYDITLSPGDYTVKINMPTYLTNGTHHGVVAAGGVSFKEKNYIGVSNEPAQNLTGGGLRIKKISSEKNTREFYYNDSGNLSTGLLLGDYNYYSPISRFHNDGNTYVVHLDFYIARTSNSNFSLSGAITGNIIGYSQVRERIVDNENPGEFIEKVYEYKNKIPERIEFLLGLPNLEDLTNGKLIKVTDYRANTNFPVKIVTNRYKYAHPNRQRLFRAASYDGTSGHLSQYTLRSSYHILSSVVTQEFDQSLFTPTVREREVYTYTGEILQHPDLFLANPPALKVKSIEKTQSNGDVLLTNIKYPQDNHFYPLPSYSTMASALADKHIYNVPYFTSTEIKKSGETSFEHLSHDYTIYDNWGSTAEGSSDLILPKTSMTLKDNLFANNFQMEKTVSLYKYDNIGNPEEYALEDGTHTVIVWGYNKQYPIAKIVNATYEPNQTNTISEAQQTAINNAVTASTNDTSDALENTLRDKLQLLRNAFPKAMITTYTYDPLIGVTSVTDPKGYTMFYTYDGFNRLQYVKDHNGNLLSENEYNYKQ